MHFEILGEISNIETFATGSRIRETARLRRICRLYGRRVGASARAIAAFDRPMAQSIPLNYIGTKPQELGRREFKIKHLLRT